MSCALPYEKVLLFRCSNAPKFPAWGRLARVFLSMAPSSAAVERIFSLCNHMFGDAQLSELADSAGLAHTALALPPLGLNVFRPWPGSRHGHGA